MKIPDLQAIAAELNSLAHDHAIGKLQDIRLELKGFVRRPGSDIFSSQTIKPEFAFHHGGRSELQFNIGLEGVPENREFRYGVAFSFETNRPVRYLIFELAWTGKAIMSCVMRERVAFDRRSQELHLCNSRVTLNGCNP